jgi:hypothetical protein
VILSSYAVPYTPVPIISSRGNTSNFTLFILFSAYNRKEFLKIKGWTKIYIPNFIHSDDIIFMVENMTDNKKMIKYFLKNLND